MPASRMLFGCPRERCRRRSRATLRAGRAHTLQNDSSRIVVFLPLDRRNPVMDALSSFAMAAGLSWASGIRLYAVLFISGMLHATGVVTLPPSLQVLAEPPVPAVSGFLVLCEFLADKVPAFDTLWDAFHTFIRIPAGALLAVGALGPANAPAAIAAALLGGALAGSSHLAKAGSRLLINTSPEPISNWAASLSEDALVPATILLAFNHPLLLFALLILFLALAIWLLPKLWRAIVAFVARVGG